MTRGRARSTPPRASTRPGSPSWPSQRTSRARRTSSPALCGSQSPACAPWPTRPGGCARRYGRRPSGGRGATYAPARRRRASWSSGSWSTSSPSPTSSSCGSWPQPRRLPPKLQHATVAPSRGSARGSRRWRRPLCSARRRATPSSRRSLRTSTPSRRSSSAPRTPRSPSGRAWRPPPRARGRATSRPPWPRWRSRPSLLTAWPRSRPSPRRWPHPTGQAGRRASSPPQAEAPPPTRPRCWPR
mmetsp:Transcript_13948/g.44267  ORF Transcript_13948/g.44267 Transcript_13948/m.44267 type:complete len:243 (+) Transcript_13948:2643-3371(+)